MSQHDYDIANQAGSLFRADLNSALAAIVSQNSGASAPSTTYAYMWWADSTSGWLKQRNSTNTAWLSLFRLSSLAPLRRPVQSKSTGYTILETEEGNTFRATSPITWTLTNVASLYDGWWCVVANDSSSYSVIDPASTQQINGASTLSQNPNDAHLVVCDGSAFRAHGLNGLSQGGGTLAGTLDYNNNIAAAARLRSYREQVVFISNASSQFTFNYNSANIFDLTITTTCTLTASNFPSSGTAAAFSVIAHQSNGSGHLIWPNSTAWAGGTAPTFTPNSGAYDIYSCVTVNGGSVINGIQAGTEFS